MDINNVAKTLINNGLKAEIKTVQKNNEAREALVVTPAESRVGVTVYLNMLEGLDDEAALNKIYEFVDEIPEGLAEGTDDFTEYELIKNRLFVSVVSVNNISYLSDKVYRTVADLAIVPRIIAFANAEGIGSALVTKSLVESWGVSEEQVIEDALKNAEVMRPLRLQGMSEIVREMMLMEMPEDVVDALFPAEDEKMYVLSTADKSQGAATIFYPGALKSVSDRIGSFYILPSSIHEVILVPNADMSADELQAMVSDVNATQVAPEEKLSDSVYYYDAEKDLFSKVA